MDRRTAMRGVVMQTDDPRWEPLEGVVGRDLAAWFMWVHEVRLSNDERIQAYKHAVTRRYLHITADRRAFELRPDGGYRDVDVARAIARAFSGWEHAAPSPDDLTALRVAIASARGLAA